jgi:hypothetical protein
LQATGGIISMPPVFVKTGGNIAINYVRAAPRCHATTD